MQQDVLRQKSGLLSQQAQDIAQYPPDPFPRERVGSGYETSMQRAPPDVLNRDFVCLSVPVYTYVHMPYCMKPYEIKG